MAQSRHFRWRLASAFAAVAVVGLLITSPSPAQAEEPQPERIPVAATLATPEDDSGIMTIAPGTHRCVEIGRSGAYHGVHCAAIDRFTNSGGRDAVRARGQTYCQRNSDSAVVPCRGAQHTVTIWNFTYPEWEETYRYCGAEVGGSTCPNGRMSTLSPGIFLYCNETYYGTVSSSITLPNGHYLALSELYSGRMPSAC